MSSNTQTKRTTSEASSHQAAAATENKSRAPAVQRACAALRLLSRHPEGLILSHVARQLGVLPSSCLHIMRELAAANLVAYHEDTKLYMLGSGILFMARQITQRNPLVQIAQPHLNRLSREFEIGASAQERDGERHLLLVAAASMLPGDMVAQGARIALFTGASGRLMAAFNPFTDAELAQRFAAARWQAPPDFDSWLKQVRSARRLGYAVDEGQYRKGITAIAAPILKDDGTVDRAISITAISAQLDDARRRVLVKAVRAAASDISAKMR